MKNETATTIKVADNGRMSLPIQQRRQIGIEKCGVVVTVENGEVRIKPVQTVVEEVQELAAKYLAGSGGTVDRFLNDRRHEESKEQQGD